jgi:hypothetical protein
MAEHSARRKSKDGRHPTTFPAQASVSDGIDGPMNTVQTARPYAAGDALAANPRAFELGERDDSVLVAGKASNEGVRISVVEFLTHVRE